MTERDPDATIRAWFHEGPSRGGPDGLERTLASLAVTGQATRREIRVPLWVPAAAMVALLLAGLLAFGAGFRIVPPNPASSPSTGPEASATACRLEVPVHGRDAILFGIGFAPDTDVVLRFDRANGSQLSVDHGTVGSLHTDRSGGFFMPIRPFPEDLGEGRITATAGCTTTLVLEVSAADLPAPCPEPTSRSQPLVDGAAYRAAVAADHPIAWWHLDDTGTAAIDSAGAHVGSYVGSVEHAVGTPLSDGGSAFLNGRFPDPALIEIQPIILHGDFTIETWVYFCHWADGDPIVGSNDSQATWAFGEGELHLNDGVQDIQWAGEDVVPGTWQHYVLVRAGDALALYLNGEVDDSSPDSGWTGDFPITMLGAGLAGNYLGYLDEVALYDHALTQEQVARHAQP